ncbi:VapE domain-containing protein [Microvirga sp. G4-2]|uniref:VapE domain-containing protein n=1 Tax=Microvirga sp. G4-2 TaxID=3434467 RepID=UPI00404439B7
MAEKFDTEQIKRDNPLSGYLMKRGIGLEKDGREFKACCPLHTEDTPSFTVFRSREGFEKFHCFGCGSFGNVIDFVQQYDGVEFPEACEILGGTREAPTRNRPEPKPAAETFDPYAGFSVLSPPADAPAMEAGKRTPQLRNPKREDGTGPKFVTYTPALVHPYRAADGSLIGYVLRVDIDPGHKITPLILWAQKDDFTGWTHHPMPEPRPLYRLEDTAAHPSMQWLVTEGEKCADVAAELIPQMVSVSWQGGGKAYARSDWSPAKGRNVVVWMDNDDEGERTTLGFWKADDWKPGLVEILLHAGTKTVKVIGRDETKPKGWDIADAHQKDGWGTKEILAYAKDRARVWTLDDIAERKRSLKESAPAPKQKGADTGEVVAPPSPVPPSRPQMRVLPGGQAQPAAMQARAPQPERIVEPGEVPAIKRYSTALAIDDTVDIPLLSRFEMDDKGNPRKKSLHNYIAASRYHPQMIGVLAWDDFSGRMMLMQRPPWIAGTEAWEPRKFDDDDARLASAWFSRAVGLQPKEDECGKAMLTAAKASRINPVRDYLDGLAWDGTARVQGEANLDPWLTEYLGARATKVNRAFGMRWLIAAVARVYEPGCKVDTMLILEGGQGKGKSTALRTLATITGHDYFTDSLHDIGSTNAVQQMRGKWIAEIPELDAMWRSEASTIKAFLSRQVDNIRVPYSKHAEDFPRTSILAGTVNPSGTGYLKDATGNRRFWPVFVGDIDIKRLEQDREQIWAEAVHLYKSGVQWWLTDEEEVLARVEQEKRQEQEPWADAIDEFVTNRAQVRMEEIMHALTLPRAQQNQKAMNRIADHLQATGWKRTRRRDKGQLKYFYVRADQTEE